MLTSTKPPEVVVPISGGKDSQACLQRALELYPADVVRGLFCDTQFEHPETYAHVERMSRFYGVRIDTIKAGSVPEVVIKHNHFPGSGVRPCTDTLKIQASLRYYKALLQEIRQGFEIWLGVRSAESAARRERYRDKFDATLYRPHEVLPSKYPQWLGRKGVRVRLPILSLSAVEVLDYLAGQENPLYSYGFDRVGCFPCLAAGDAYKEKAFNFDDFGRSQKAIVDDLQRRIGKSVWQSKGGQLRNPFPIPVVLVSEPSSVPYEDVGSGCSFCQE